MILEEKNFQREKYISLRDGLSDISRLKKSRAILNRLNESTLFESSKDIGFYCAFGSEVETSEMIKSATEAGKSIYLPVIDPIDKEMHFCHFDGDMCSLTTNSFGIPEPKKMLPIADELLDLIIVPGLVFTKEGWRIGHGAGYYDRYLKKVAATTCGVAFSVQISDSFPVDDYDVPLDYVLTEDDFFVRVEPKPDFSDH